MRPGIRTSLALLAMLSAAPTAAFGDGSVTVRREPQLRSAWANPHVRSIELKRDIVLRACRLGDPIRESPGPVRLDGGGHTLRQACFEKRVLRQDGTGFVALRDVTLTRGGSDGPGAAITSRGEIKVVDSEVSQNLSEEPGGGIMSQRRVTVVRSVITGNLANDDGGGVYARRGGIQVYDSVVSGNLVDGSGGALASTGDILVVRSHVDGNTTDGDGGAIYADEDGDVTVVDSTVNGSTADGPGGAIFTLDGDVTVVGSTLNGNRADDRGGAISGEATVTVINSTIARNAAVAHVGGGIWARGDLYLANSTVSDNYAEGEGGGLFGAGRVGLVNATVVNNLAPVAANVGAGQRLDAFGSIIGPAKVDGGGGQAQPTDANCHVSSARSFGFNVVTDSSCRLRDSDDLIGGAPRLGPLTGDGGSAETRAPVIGSPALDRIPARWCGFPPFGRVFEGEQHLSGLVADPATLVERDQRGVPRPQGAGCDAGAVELASASSAGAGLAAADPGSVDAVLRRLERMTERMERSADRHAAWRACVRRVPVSEYGDPDRQFGYAYDERDGTGRGHMPALAIDRRGRPRRPDFLFLAFSSRRGCTSDAPTPDGTADPASALQTPKSLEGRVGSLKRSLRRLRAASERFDEWESCVSWVPVTEYGDPDGGFGYLFGPRRSSVPRYRSALAIDRSDRDDPDYMFLGFVGADRPGGDCRDESDGVTPSQAAVGGPRAHARGESLQAELGPLAEEVEDIQEPLAELTLFDECMYLIGASTRGTGDGRVGYFFGLGGRVRRQALALDIRGFGLPQHRFLAFPGEEPPSIECNEDAGEELVDD